MILIPRKSVINRLTIITNFQTFLVICPKDANRMANIEDPDQTAPLGLHFLP